MRKFDPAFTQKLRAWLDDENRDCAEGALLLLRLRGNQREYMKLSADPEHYRQYIFDNIKKFYDFRAADISHDHVVARVEKAEKIAANVAEISSESTGEGQRSGKRADHDKLPEDVQQCYVNNADLMHRIGDLHTKIRLIVKSDASCKDADLLPFAEEIIRLDKKRLANWKKYDNYVIS